MLRTNEIKSIMPKLRENSDVEEVKNESVKLEATASVAEEADTDNDTSEADLLLARLEDIIARFEKALAIVDEDGGEEEAPAEEAPAEEAPAEEEEGEEEAPAEEEEEPAAEESYKPSLEDRLAALERRFTESRRRRACRKFNR
jgi:hypothetical protein